MLPVQAVIQGRYRVESLVARGGQGIVYRVTDLRLATPAALKLLAPADPASRAAFPRESHLLARLRHPTLPRATDHRDDPRGPCLVMDFVPGDDLAAQLLRRLGVPLPPATVLAWADQLLDALAYPHARQPRPARAAQLLGAAAAPRAAIGHLLLVVQQADHNATVEAARAARSARLLSPPAWADGQTLPLEEAIQMALEEM